MIRFAPVALATLLAATALPRLQAQIPAQIQTQIPAQTAAPFKPFTDSANLAGERVSPRTGRELPIDGGPSNGSQPNTTLGLKQLLRKLSTRASILNIVAHPDDEDGGMLTLYSRGLGARVADLALTRGEGGQNAATGDFEDALGLLRTQELLSNDRYTGVTQMFGTEVDFGFSKTKSEAFAKWDHQRVLYDVVRAIRIYRPLVITATFIGAPTDGHGQHQVSGEIAQEAFLAAGDPAVFPELTREGILPWQPLKMYARVPTYAITPKGLFDYATGQYVPAEFTNYVTGKSSTTPPSADIVIHEGTNDPLITTCAANASDLPGSLRPANSFLSSRSAAEGSASPSQTTTDCKPLTYVQFARIGLGLQRSQIGPGVRNAPSGAFDVPYHLYGSRISSQREQAPTARNIPAQGNALGTPPQESRRAESPIYNPALENQPNFFDGIDTTIEGIATLAPSAKGNIALVIETNLAGIEHSIAQAELDLKPDHPELAAHRLSEALTLTNMTLKNIEGFTPAQLPADERANLLHELRTKRVQLNDALVVALGLSIDASASGSELPVRSTATVHTVLSTSSNERIPFFTEELQSANGILQRGPMSDRDPAVTRSKPWIEDITAKPDLTQTETRPYFFRDNIEQPIYQLRNASLRNAPATPPALVAWANLIYNGTDIRLGQIVESRSQPVQFVPAYSLSLTARAQVLPVSNPTLLLGADIVPFMTNANLKIEAPAGWHVHPDPQANPPNELTWSFDQINVDHAPRKPVTIPVSVSSSDGHTYTEGFRPVGYGDLPRTNIYTPATDRIVPVDLKLPPADKRRIAYLPGTGDDVPAALASIGLTPTILTVSDLTPAKLSAFDTIILGVRTYNAHPDLHGAPTQALLDFARSGGNVVVQYQTPEFTAADAPYPLTDHNERVVDETAPVQLLDPSSALFTTPNRITSADFNGWIEERGHGFLESWDPHYTALTETHDPGAPSEHVQPQAPQRGGLITVQLGKGRWTYCAFALYRQLPEAVPGAFRIFVNLLNP
jgi:LmbE family N-acetylglucosaminyl deacetylase